MSNREVRMNSEPLFVPVFTLLGRRYRARLRFIASWRFSRVTHVFLQGSVHRFWVGAILLTVMIDRPDEL